MRARWRSWRSGGVFLRAMRRAYRPGGKRALPVVVRVDSEIRARHKTRHGNCRLGPGIPAFA